MNRTQNEIVARIEMRKSADVFGFELECYLQYLDYGHVKPYLEDHATRELWETEGMETRDPKDVMADYMPFAWDKANSFRGISACRSVCHYIAWLWLDGNEELSRSLEAYECYGKPQLAEVCKYLGLDPSKWDDGVRMNSEREEVAVEEGEEARQGQEKDS